MKGKPNAMHDMQLVVDFNDITQVSDLVRYTLRMLWSSAYRECWFYTLLEESHIVIERPLKYHTLVLVVPHTRVSLTS